MAVSREKRSIFGSWHAPALSLLDGVPPRCVFSAHHLELELGDLCDLLRVVDDSVSLSVLKSFGKMAVAGQPLLGIGLHLEIRPSGELVVQNVKPGFDAEAKGLCEWTEPNYAPPCRCKCVESAVKVCSP